MNPEDIVIRDDEGRPYNVSASGAPFTDEYQYNPLTRLQDCPFCGAIWHQLEKQVPDEQEDEVVHCKICGAYGPQPSWAEQDPLKLWNIRRGFEKILERKAWEEKMKNMDESKNKKHETI